MRRAQIDRPSRRTSGEKSLRRPIVPRRRVPGLDAARGLALIGMILVNVGPVASESLIQRTYLFPYGRASVLFVVVAGLGMGYLLRSQSGPERWSTIAWRALLLFGGGLMLQRLTDSVQVILPLYGLLFLLSPLLWKLPTRALAIAAAGMTVAGPAIIVTHSGVEPGRHYTDAAQLGASPASIVHSLLLSGPYPLASWIVPFTIGLVLSRLDLTRTRTLTRMGLGGATAAVGGFVLAALAARVLGESANSGPGRLLTGVAHGQMPLWLVSSIGGAVLVMAVFIAVAAAIPHRVVWLTRMGQLALTIYVAHVLVLALVEPEVGFTFVQGVLVTLAMVSVALVFASWWAKTGRPGPFEWLLRATWLRPPYRPFQPVRESSR